MKTANGSGKMYTIKEAADLLGMSKPGIRYRLKLLNVSLARDEAGRIVLDEETLQRLKTDLKPEREPERTVESEEALTGKTAERDGDFTGKTERKPEKEAESGKKAENEESDLHFALSMLREQLAAKDAQIEALTKQLADVTEALKGSQALHAATVKMLQGATEEPDTAERDEPEEPKRRGLWGWLTRTPKK